MNWIGIELPLIVCFAPPSPFAPPNKNNAPPERKECTPPEQAAAPPPGNSIKTVQQIHKSTVILIELPCFSFCAMMEVDEAEGLSAMLDDDW